MLQLVKREDRRQSLCPTCKAVRGTPISVAMALNQRLIAYRCPACAAEWKVAHLTPARATLRPQESGRKEA
jgi:hypothetical protein